MSIFWNRLAIFIVYRKILNISNNSDIFEITFIPLLTLYIIKIINRVQLTMKGVLYRNWDSIKLFMLYRRVIARVINNRDRIMLMINPSLLPNRLFIFSFNLKS